METTLSAKDLQQRILSSEQKLPGHIAIIMDGNGRWARKRGLPRTFGHKAGVSAVKKIVRVSGDLGIKYLTLFTFSSENWNRPRYEVSALMKLLYEATRDELDELHENNVKFITSGNIEKFPRQQHDILMEAIDKTRNNTGLVLNLALNYGGRDEILAAVRRIAEEVDQGKLRKEDINEELFSSYLFHPEIPDPDLLIRTSGEMRISNFLLWQTSYTELYITSTMWPDFSEEDYYNAILEYQSRERRFGSVSSDME
ncbi:MAG: isoprenyl transferase [candidate division Zixibacteria bacterium]|nr:isoprenyl transferase [candidate division Zixibacteria bacterium]